jgi:hypothetical protein
LQSDAHCVGRKDETEKKIGNLIHSKLNKNVFSIDGILDFLNIRDWLVKRIEKGRIRRIFPKDEFVKHKIKKKKKVLSGPAICASCSTCCCAAQGRLRSALGVEPMSGVALIHTHGSSRR